MKHIFRLINRSTAIALFAISFSMLSCEGEEGSIGPKGDTGAQGEQGLQGEQGIPGEDGSGNESILVKAGYAEGTITGTRQDGTEFTETFKYEYAPELEIMNHGGMQLNAVYLRRYGNAGGNYESNTSFFQFGFYRDENDNLVPQQFVLQFTKVIDATSVFSFSANNYIIMQEGLALIETTNYVYDEETGVLTFDFSYTDEVGNQNTTGNPVTITGSFNSGHKIYKNIVMRGK
ncbi:MAG TPA: collagen-like protein [Ohtaekwangia sp.]|nr:collagen-like protein [Ohtaekwangia sp.]